MAVSTLFYYARRGSSNHHGNILYFPLKIDLGIFKKTTIYSMLLKSVIHFYICPGASAKYAIAIFGTHALQESGEPIRNV